VGGKKMFIWNIGWKTGVTWAALKACHGWEDNIKMNLNKTMGERALDSCDSG